MANVFPGPVIPVTQRTCNCSVNPFAHHANRVCTVPPGVVCKHQRATEWKQRLMKSPMVKIVSCRDSLMWYSGKVGQIITIKNVDTDGLWAVDNGNHINIVRFEDVEWKDPTVENKPKCGQMSPEELAKDNVRLIQENILLKNRLEESRLQLEQMKKFHLEQANTILEYQDKFKEIGIICQNI